MVAKAARLIVSEHEPDVRTLAQLEATGFNCIGILCQRCAAATNLAIDGATAEAERPDPRRAGREALLRQVRPTP